MQERKRSAEAKLRPVRGDAVDHAGGHGKPKVSSGMFIHMWVNIAIFLVRFREGKFSRDMEVSTEKRYMWRTNAARHHPRFHPLQVT